MDNQENKKTADSNNIEFVIGYALMVIGGSIVSIAKLMDTAKDSKIIMWLVLAGIISSGIAKYIISIRRNAKTGK